jgi:hypothetical protein
VAIHKKVRHHSNQTADAAEPVFSYPASPALQNVIVDAWLNRPFTYTPSTGGAPVTIGLQRGLLDRDRHGNPTQQAFDVATTRIGSALGVVLKRAVVITEAEHDNDYFKDEDEIVFVLPNATLVAAGHLPDPPPPPPNPADLLETAKLLMACTPNGI